MGGVHWYSIQVFSLQTGELMSHSKLPNESLIGADLVAVIYCQDTRLRELIFVVYCLCV